MLNNSKLIMIVLYTYSESVGTYKRREDVRIEGLGRRADFSVGRFVRNSGWIPKRRR